MRLTTKGRYAVTALLDLAIHHDAGPVPLAGIALRQDISQSYLEQLFGRLKKSGLVRSSRGPGGGYELVDDAETVSVSEILTAVGEGFDATRCGGSGDCKDGQTCLTHELWSDLSMQIDLFLSRITLASLLERGDIMSIARRLEDVDLIEARLI
ncbi:MAG: Rrf2 family transcriptional regulator [Pseudomonadota bacterium]|nr:Rrf2 family transcriptional regulator [Pseudomonadota bacterium]